MPVLGVILFFGGIELAAGVNSETFSRTARTVLVVTAGIAPWNMGVAYVARLLLHHAARRKIVQLAILSSRRRIESALSRALGYLTPRS